MSAVGTALAGKVATKGLLGTYENGLNFIANGGLPVTGKGGEALQTLLENSEHHHNGLDTTASACAIPESSPSTHLPPERPPIHLLFLGSSIGNFARGEDSQFLRSLPLRPGSGDTLLLGLSHHNTREEIELAYNDVKGHTRAFIMNGLRSAGEALSDPDLFSTNNWEYINAYNEASRA